MGNILFELYYKQKDRVLKGEDYKLLSESEKRLLFKIVYLNTAFLRAIGGFSFVFLNSHIICFFRGTEILLKSPFH